MAKTSRLGSDINAKVADAHNSMLDSGIGGPKTWDDMVATGNQNDAIKSSISNKYNQGKDTGQNDHPFLSHVSKDF
jgi:hypothetical protein